MNTAVTAAMFALSGVIGCGSIATQDESSSETVSAGMEHVVFETNIGSIVIEVDVENAPITAENFLQYVDDGFYDRTVFHRIMENFVVQGGGFAKGMVKKKTRPGIKNEWENGLKNLYGTLSMARLGGKPDSGTSQFFINLKDNTSLDIPRDGAAYAVFAKVVAGMPVVDMMAMTWVATTDTPNGKMQNVPVYELFIKEASRVAKEDVSMLLETVDKMNAPLLEKWATDDVDRQFAMAENLIESFDVKLDGAYKTESGLWVLDETVGEAEDDKVQAGERVIAHYHVWLPNGQLVQTSRTNGAPITIGLKTNSSIAAWIEGVPGMVPGGVRWLISPSGLAYGAQGRPGIPSDTSLIFKIELVERLPNE